jgi:hypothetical protein
MVIGRGICNWCPIHGFAFEPFLLTSQGTACENRITCKVIATQLPRLSYPRPHIRDYELSLHRDVCFPMTDARYAYHEAGHAVAAAVLGFSFRSSGMHIDHAGIGVTLILCPSRACSNAFSDLQRRQKRMVIVLFTGIIAQKKFCPNASTKSAADDENKIDQYLSAIYRADEAAKRVARSYLAQEAERLVETFWFAICIVADVLWGKEWSPVTEDWGTKLQMDKTLDGSELVGLLKTCEISCGVDDCTPEEPLVTVAD